MERRRKKQEKLIQIKIFHISCVMWWENYENLAFCIFRDYYFPIGYNIHIVSLTHPDISSSFLILRSNFCQTQSHKDSPYIYKRDERVRSSVGVAFLLSPPPSSTLKILFHFSYVNICYYQHLFIHNVNIIGIEYFTYECIFNGTGLGSGCITTQHSKAQSIWHTKYRKLTICHLIWIYPMHHCFNSIFSFVYRISEHRGNVHDEHTSVNI